MSHQPQAGPSSTTVGPLAVPGRSQAVPRGRDGAFDLLRFFAGVVVLIAHFAFSSHAAGRTGLHSSLLAPGIKYAYLVVDVFLILSGYFVLMTAQGRTWKPFLIARVARIWPGLVVCATITYVGGLLLPAGASTRTISLVDWFGNVTFLAFVPGGHFFFNIADVVYWTLFFDFAFYALVAIGLAIGLVQQRFVAALLALCTVIVAASYFVPERLYYAVVFAGLLSRFALGGALYSIAVDRRSPGAWALLAGATAVSLVNVWARAVTRVQIEFEPFNPWIACTVTILMILGLLALVLRPVVKDSPLTALLGGVTLPLYLLHHQLGCAVANVLGLGDDIVAVFGLTAAWVVVATFVYVSLERPLVQPLHRALRERFLRRERGGDS